MSQRKKKIYRILAVYLAMNLLAQIGMPTAAFALTNGPGQPEFQSFEPAGTTDMVNLFTGDFNYNIPLMTVPGPNGGYPINMAYHAGIGTEQEASWVGLGWNINAGAINRAMRGLPDDFNGENVKKGLHFKPATSFEFTYGASIARLFGETEILGFNPNTSMANMHLYYNNYRGVGFKFGLSLVDNPAEATSTDKAKPYNLNLSTSSDGIGVNVSYSHLWDKNEADKNINYGWNAIGGLAWSSREGITQLSLGGGYLPRNSKYNIGSGVSFTKSSYVPSTTPEMTGFIATLGVMTGLDDHMKWPTKKSISLEASLARSWVKNPDQDYPAYGYLYAENSTAISGGNVMDDMNREKDAPPTRQTKTLAVPVATYDVYSVSGQGVGGTFRPYRSDMGIYTEPGILSKIRGGDIEGEIGPDSIPPSGSSKFGADLAYNQSKTYSGIWANNWGSADNSTPDGFNPISNYEFHGSGYTADRLYEPFYFKMSGELTSNPANQLDFIGNDAPMFFKNTKIFGTPIFPHPEILTDQLFYSEHSSASINLDDSKDHRLYREKRVVSNQQLTNSQLAAMGTAPANVYGSAAMNSFPATGGTATPGTFNYAGHSATQIGQFTEVNPDGNRYVYGIPVYTTTKEVTFSDEGNHIGNDYSIDYYTTDFTRDISIGTHPQASTDNQEANTDQYYSSTTLPEYAESYLLTAIYSPDYVDVTGNGPTADDLGYYVKFNYVKAYSDYKWRAPYASNKGILNAGYLSNPKDDKLSYQYGEKEIYYLHSIETKTHVAYFFLQDVANGRLDGRATYTEIPPYTPATTTPVTNSQKLWALDHIALYSKADPNYGTANATPLKSVYFTYDNSLCAGVYNNIQSENQNTPPIIEQGKLTLLSIYFTYLNNAKGKLSPYTFDYIDTGYDLDLRNPAYDPEANDRWGNYKKQEDPVPPAPPKYLNKENPYVDQLFADSARVSQSAAAWSLKKITLPSGSEINIKYEADDYAYVQDKQALQMCRVVGTGKGNLLGLADIGSGLTRDYYRIYFELNKPIEHSLNLNQQQKDAIAKKYIAGMTNMYFKMFVALKKPYAQPNDPKLYDYVDGYCTVSQQVGSYGVVTETSNTTDRFGFITVDPVDRDDYPATNVHDVNPIRKAAWQHIYLDRPDLFAPVDVNVSSTIQNLAAAAVNMIADIPRAIAPYITAAARNWADVIDVNASYDCNIRPSYIRLNAPDGIKKGGGHRVSKIFISDSWNTLSNYGGATAMYGQKYTYRLIDGKSSGVAAYEPMIGGEEIPLRQPIRYNSNNLVKKDQAFYVEEPMGESYFPAPVVGYSRVIVESIVGDIVGNRENKDKDPTNPNAPYLDITKSRTGKTVYEFYTSKDYPVICRKTELQKTKFALPIILPTIGSITYNNRGFSQGYSVVLNDMHGKLKAVSTYPYSTNLNSSNPIPVRRVFYKYNGGYDATKANQLNSTVTVLTKDGETQQANLGETYDFFTDLRQHSNKTLNVGAQINVEISSQGVWSIPTFLPKINTSKSLYRSAVTMKVIYRTGILMDVETTDDGAKSTAHNLMFDAETGAPLLTSVTNEFEKPVYTYNFAAHWAYDRMNGAYKNIGASCGGTTNAAGQLSVSNADALFFPGDEVLYMVQFPLSGASQLLWVKTVTGSTVTFMDAAGSSVSTDVANLVFGTFTIIRSGNRNLQSVSNGTIVSLSNPVTSRIFPLFTVLNTLTTLSDTTTYNFQDCVTGLNQTFTVNYVPTQHLIQLQSGGDCTAFINFPLTYTMPALLSDFNNCDFTKAGNAVTVTFPNSSTQAATWSDPGNCYNECLDDVLHAASVRFSDDWAMDFADVGVTPTPTSAYNQYRYAEKGVWRTESNYLYQVDRKQSAYASAVTDISKDGTYQNFNLYNWSATAPSNKHWSYVSQISRYSPYGYALETRDALGIYSSTMYGYDNTKQIAAGSNCQYFELANDAFEDYTSAFSGHGHLNFTAVNAGLPPVISASFAHTGKKSLSTTFNGDAQYQVVCDGSPFAFNQQYFEATPTLAYNFSVWALATNGGTPAVVIDNGSTIQTFTPDIAQSPIEGWKRIDVKFTAPAANNTLTITLKCQTSGTAYFDDIRIQPYKSAMVSYVYDPQTHWLLAELDNRNFATFYNYDEEGSLVQVKQETEKGIFTVKTSRSNIKRP